MGALDAPMNFIKKGCFWTRFSTSRGANVAPLSALFATDFRPPLHVHMPGSRDGIEADAIGRGEIPPGSVFKVDELQFLEPTECHPDGAFARARVAL